MATKVLTKLEYGGLLMFLAVTITTASVPISLLAADLFTNSIAHSLMPQAQVASDFSLHDMLSLFKGEHIAVSVSMLGLLLPFGIMYSTSKFKKSGFIGFRPLNQKWYTILLTISFAVFLAFSGAAYSSVHQPSLDSNSLAGSYMLIYDGFLFLISSGLCLSGLILHGKKQFYSQSLFWSAIMIIVLWAWSFLSDMQF
jgi:hypothetical protein